MLQVGGRDGNSDYGKAMAATHSGLTKVGDLVSVGIFFYGIKLSVFDIIHSVIRKQFWKLYF